jgi:hypothetical protein
MNIIHPKKVTFGPLKPTHPPLSDSEVQRIRIVKLLDDLTMHTWLA